MFGYVKPLPGEMLLKEYELYKAIYCGLCRTGGKRVSRLTRLFLSYDFTALAALRLALTGEKAATVKARCPYSLKKKPALECDEAFTYTAAAFACLGCCKAEDDVKDARGVKRLFKRLPLSLFKRMRKRADALYPGLYGEVKGRLEGLWAIENDGRSHSLDEYANGSAEALAVIASFGLDGKEAAIANEAGYHIGRYVYLLDAADDLREDGAKGRFNPLISCFGGLAEAEGRMDEVYGTLAASAVRFSAALGLAESGIYTDILENIARFGMENTAKAVYDKYGYKRKENEKL